MLAAGPGTAVAGDRTRWTNLIRDRSVALGLTLSAMSLLWFSAGPLASQRLVFRVVAPLFTCMIAAGQWRLGGVQARTSRRFWRMLSLGMFTYAGGMILDLATIVFRLPLDDAGETLLYPVAGVLTIAALIVYPASTQTRAERLRMVLDVVTVLLGSATFVWYFLVSQRWEPSDGWERLSDGLVLPALTLVAGFVILRITIVGDAVISRPTTYCFVLGAISAAAPVIVGAPITTTAGRFSSIVHLAGFMSCVVGVAIQRLGGWTAADRPRTTVPAWRRSFTVLPYVAMVGTLILVLATIRNTLTYRSWAVVIGAMGLGAIVVFRQLASLWENYRLLGANRELTGRLEHQAFHDHLTGLANRTLFTDRVTEALERSRRDGSTVAVLFVDLDDFKVVNDSLGHHVGDELLVAVASRLRDAVPAHGCLGRLGGDEFAMLVPDGAQATAERIADILALPFRVSGLPVDVNASVGIATARGGRPDAAELLRNADVAMYSAKNSQKGSWRVFQPAMLAAVLRRHQMRAALAEAVSRHELVVHYQPIIDLLDGTVHGAEALVRWRQPGGGLALPNQFIPLAEETGLITRIDQWVLEQACRQAMRWGAAAPHGRPFALHVNLSARHLHRPDLVDDVALALRRNDIPAAQLTLEITESGLGHNHEAAIVRLGELCELGVHLAIDDFGTGYSSLAYLQRMPVNVLKIDKTFTDAVADPPAPAPLVQAVIALADALGMQTVAEGIERPGQADRLLALGCRYGQGFLFARPLAPAQMDLFLRRAPKPRPLLR